MTHKSVLMRKVCFDMPFLRIPQENPSDPVISGLCPHGDNQAQFMTQFQNVFLGKLVRQLVRDFKPHGEFSRGLTKLETPFCETIIDHKVLSDQARIDIDHEVTKVESGQISMSFHDFVTV